MTKLRESGFTNIQYLKDGKIETIQIVQSEGADKRDLKILTKTFLTEAEITEFNKVTGSISICSGDNTLQDAISHGALPIFIPHKSGKENVLGNLEQFLRDNKLSHAADYVKIYKENKELFKPQNSSGTLKNQRVHEVCDKITPELLEEWPKACKEIVKNFNLKDLLTSYVNKLASGEPYRTAGDLLNKYLKIASDTQRSNIGNIYLTPEELIPAKGHIELSESELKEYIMDNKLIDGEEAILYADHFKILIDGKSALIYLIENDIETGIGDPIEYAQQQLEEANAEDHYKFYIKDPKNGIEKSPVQYAIDNNISVDGTKSFKYAIDGNHYFTANGLEVNSTSAIIEYALSTRKIEDNVEIVEYAILNKIEIQRKNPVIYLQENGFYFQDFNQVIKSPIKFANDNNLFTSELRKYFFDKFTNNLIDPSLKSEDVGLEFFSFEQLKDSYINISKIKFNKLLPEQKEHIKTLKKELINILTDLVSDDQKLKYDMVYKSIENTSILELIKAKRFYELLPPHDIDSKTKDKLEKFISECNQYIINSINNNTSSDLEYADVSVSALSFSDLATLYYEMVEIKQNNNDESSNKKLEKFLIELGNQAVAKIDNKDGNTFIDGKSIDVMNSYELSQVSNLYNLVNTLPNDNKVKVLTKNIETLDKKKVFLKTEIKPEMFNENNRDKFIHTMNTLIKENINIGASNDLMKRYMNGQDNEVTITFEKLDNEYNAYIHDPITEQVHKIVVDTSNHPEAIEYIAEHERIKHEIMAKYPI